ncbi:hypothetical protein [Marinobacter sp.]|uniref:hypothetical protein n=1 Tax=Marinobacter sp. TaxID=50741 RepID=UPI003B518ADA
MAILNTAGVQRKPWVGGRYSQGEFRAETESARGFGNFSENAITIAGNGFVDQMVLIREGASFKPNVY